MSSELAQIYDIGELVDVTQGLAINSKTKHLLRDEGLPLLRITDLFSGSYSQFVTQEGVPKQCIANSEELIYTRTGQVGFVFTNKVGVVHNNCFKVTPKDDRLSRRYLYWYLRQESVRSYVNTVASGSVQKDLNHSAFKTLKIPLLDLEAQRQIDSILSSLDDRITLLRETNATLDAIAQALFKSWFVDFDPVHAKMEGRTPEGMDEATAALFPDGSETSELGEVPRGWRVGRLDDLLVLQRGFDLPAQDRTPGSYPIIAASGPAGTHTEAMVSGPGVVTGRSGVLGRVFLCLDNFWPLNTTLWVKEFKAASACYAYEVLRLLDFKSFNAGSAVPTLNRNHIHGLPYLIPTRECIQAYESVAMPLHQRVKQNELQAQTLSTLRDTLLPRLISGQLRLPEAQAALEATP